MSFSIRFPWLLGLSLLWTISCSKPATTGGPPPLQTPAETSGQAADFDSVTITLERTSCYGTCPVYEVSIDETGLVQYRGKAFVQVEGKQTRRITPEAVRRLVGEFLAIDFFQLNGRYDSMGGLKVSDLPTTITTINLDGRRKRVEDYVGAPDALRGLEALIDETAGVREWTGKK